MPEAAHTLADITAAALAAIPGAAYAGIARVQRHGGIHAQAATHAIAGILDRLHVGQSGGPGSTALHEQRTVTVGDLDADTNWPGFAALAGELGVRGVVCLPLRVRDTTLGTLHFYATAAHAFTEDDKTVAEVFATRAALALDAVQERQLITHAVTDRNLVGQATGTLMARHRLTATDASAILERISCDTHRSVADLARDLVAHHGHQVASRLPVLCTRTAAHLTVVEVAGDVDAATGPQLREHLGRLPATDTLVDLSQVTFLAVDGLRMLRQRRTQLASTGHTLRVTGAAPSLHRVLALAGLNEIPARTQADPADSPATAATTGPSTGGRSDQVHGR